MIMHKTRGTDILLNCIEVNNVLIFFNFKIYIMSFKYPIHKGFPWMQRITNKDREKRWQIMA